MKKFSKMLERIMRNFGHKPALAKRVAEALQSGNALTFNQLVEKISPKSPSELALLLADLQAAHVIDQVIRVESPETHSGIREFQALDEVPNRIYDFYADRYIDVTPANVVVLFRPSART